MFLSACRAARYGIGALFALLTITTSAAGAPKEALQQCTQSYEQGQRLRKKGSLLEAKRELGRCSSEACPTALATDCLKWLGEVEAALPSIVVAVVDPEGRDIVDARVTINDATSGDLGTGRAFEVDPGTHRIRATAPGQPEAEETVIVREGEKRRAVRIVVGATKKEPAPVEAPKERGILPYALLGLGVLSLGAAGGFGIYGLSERKVLDACRPECETDRVDATNRAFLVSDIFLAVGLIATGIGGYLFFTQPSASPPAQAVR